MHPARDSTARHLSIAAHSRSQLGKLRHQLFEHGRKTQAGRRESLPACAIRTDHKIDRPVLQMQMRATL
jgi:hypothetical protein